MTKIKDRYIKFGVSSQETNDGDIPSIYSPTVNYTPDQVSSEGADKISAYLKGIDNYFSTLLSGLLAKPNIVCVKKSNAGTGEFTSIKTAVDSITTASASNPFIVSVGPGIFTEDPITMKPYVYLVGAEQLGTVIQPTTNTNTIITPSPNSEIVNVKLTGATGVGGKAIHYSPSASGSSIVRGVVFGNNETQVNVFGNATTTVIRLEYCTFGGAGNSFTNGIQVSNNPSVNTFVVMFSCQLSIQSAPYPAFIGKCFGAGTRLSVASCTFLLLGTNTCDGFIAYDGADLRINSTSLRGLRYALESQNTGAAPNIVTQGAWINDSSVYDIYIQHPTTTGNHFGTSEYAKTVIPQNAPFYIRGAAFTEIIVAKKGGDFSSIKAALDSITASSSTNPYVVRVTPGVYTEQQMTIPDFVSVEGESINAVIVEPSANNHHLFVMGNSCEISFITLRGLLGAGYAGIVAQDVGDFAQTFKVSIQDFDIGILCETTTTDSEFYAEYTDIQGDFSFGVRAMASNGFKNLVQLENFFTYPSLGTNPIAVRAIGTTMKCQVFTCQLSCDVAQKGFVTYNGAYLKLNGVVVDGADAGLEVQNTGSAPIVASVATVFRNCGLDVNIEHPGATGSLFGGIDPSNSFIDPSANIAVLALTSTQDGIAINGQILYSQTSLANLTDISQLIINTPPMGLIHGGALSVSSGLTLSIAAGFGYNMNGTEPNDVINKRDWISSTLAIPASSARYVFINDIGNFASDSAYPDTEENLLLGRVVTNGSDILYIEKTPLKAHHISNAHSRMLREAIGSVFRSGCLVSASGTRNLDVTTGVYYFAENRFTPTGGTAVSFDTFYQSGTPGVYVRTAAQTTVSNSLYDDGSGTLASIPTGDYAKHLLLVMGGPSENYLFVYATATYDTLAEAQAAPLPVTPAFMSDSFVRVASIVVQQGQSAIQDIIDERPRVGIASSSSVGGVTSHSALSDLNADDHTQYLLVSGTRSMTGSLDMGSNNITSAGTINGVTITAHASRHLPNGADPLTTATPSDTGTANSEGIANSFARSDHGHKTVIQKYSAIANGTTTSTSTTDVALQTITNPISGTYILNAAVHMTHGTNNATITASIYVGGALVTSTDVTFTRSINQVFTYAINTEVAVNGSQNVEIRWRTSTGTMTATLRSMTMTKVS